MILAKEMMPAKAKAVAIPGTSSIVLMNATPQDVAKLKKLLDQLDTQNQPRPPVYSPRIIPSNDLPQAVPSRSYDTGSFPSVQPVPLEVPRSTGDRPPSLIESFPSQPKVPPQPAPRSTEPPVNTAPTIPPISQRTT